MANSLGAPPTLGAQASMPAGFRAMTDCPEQAGMDACAPRMGGAPRYFALIPSMRPFGKTGQTASLPYLFLRSFHVALRRPETMKIRRFAHVLAGRSLGEACPRGRGRAIFRGDKQ